jgi:hypothetical protein
MSKLDCAVLLAAPFLIAAAAGAADPHNHQLEDAPTEKVHACYPGENGHLTGQLVEMPVEEGFLEIQQQLESRRGGPDNRLDLVFVGDGYTAGQMNTYHSHVNTYHSHVNTITNQFFNYEPYKSYEPYFRVTAVEVVSVDSGVDNDTSQNVSRNTALDMAYWCSGIERLLCVSVSKAYSHANAGAPDVDQVLAVANSSKYGGAGYPSSNLGTLAGANGSAVDIAIHENGHSLGDLADEYTYGGPSNYTGGDPSSSNASIYTQSQQTSQSRKWYQWMGTSRAGFDGPVGAYEGANYSVTGIYRPSNNSMMRSLGRPFNLPSAEKLIKEIYREVNPIDGGLANGSTVDVSEDLWITPMQPIGHDLDIEWIIDGVSEPLFDSMSSINLSSYGLDGGSHTVEVRVVDNTSMVRDESIRDQFLSQTRSFTVTTTPCITPANLNGDSVLDIFDLFEFIVLFTLNDISADYSGDGVLDIIDLFSFISIFNAGCP